MRLFLVGLIVGSVIGIGVSSEMRDRSIAGTSWCIMHSIQKDELVWGKFMYRGSSLCAEHLSAYFTSIHK